MRALLLLALLMPGPAAAAPDGAGEYQVKAAFLLNFTGFIEWPESQLPAGAPLVIGVFGKDPFGGALTAAIHGKTVNNHRLFVAHITRPQDLRLCQIVFVAGSEARPGSVLAAVAGAPVVAVGEADGFLEAGGTINLVLEQRKIRFEIDTRATSAAGVRISSKLLALARRVVTQ